MQHKGSIILDYLEQLSLRKQSHEQAQRDLRRVKEAIVASGRGDLETLFPEYFKPDVVEDDTPIAEGTLIDYSAVEWKSPSDARDEYESLMEQVRSMSKGSFDAGSVTVDPDAGWR